MDGWMDEWMSRLHTLLFVRKEEGELLVLPHDTQALCGAAAADNNPGHCVTIPFLGLMQSHHQAKHILSLSYTLYSCGSFIVIVVFRKQLHLLPTMTLL